jgi:hypothetical protein
MAAKRRLRRGITRIESLTLSDVLFTAARMGARRDGKRRLVRYFRTLTRKNPRLYLKLLGKILDEELKAEQSK